MSESSTTQVISIDVLKDLNSGSALRSMLTSQEGAVFQILGELSAFATQPAAAAATATISAEVTLSTEARWKTSNGIGFSLTPRAKCAVSISPSSKSFAVAMSIESTDAKDTQVVAALAPPNSVYVNIDLDFSIEGSVSGSATSGAFGIAGKAAGSGAATLSFCQPVNAALTTLEAITAAFEQLIFPLDPNCTDRMQPGTLSKVAFDASFKCELEATYGLGSYKVAAPDSNSVRESLGNLAKLNGPSVSADCGVKASMTYGHSSHFALIVNRKTEAVSTVYLVRSSEDDAGVAVGLNVGITTTAPSVSIDTARLGSLVKDVTKSDALASTVAGAATKPANGLETALNGKLAGWASSVTGDVGLTVGLSRQKSHAALFIFDVDIKNHDAKIGWAALVGGSVSSALTSKGFTLQPGCGVADSLKRSATLRFQFFNFFALSSTSDYFSDSYTEFGKDGTIRIVRRLGKEKESDTKDAVQKFRIFFEASATQDATSVAVSNAQIDLCIEMSEHGDSKYAARMANVIGFLPKAVASSILQDGMMKFVGKRPAGVLDLKINLKSSAYGRLLSAPFSGKTPPLSQKPDMDNWVAFQKATDALDHALNFVEDLHYDNWATFNVTCWDQMGSTKTADRHQLGDLSAAPPSFFRNLGDPNLVRYFFAASQAFMNLCDDLRILAAGIPSVTTSSEWERTLSTLTKLMTKDVYLDYGVPTCAALLDLCGRNGAVSSGTLCPSSDGSGLACLVTVT